LARTNRWTTSRALSGNCGSSSPFHTWYRRPGVVKKGDTKGGDKVSTQDLISKWEDALAQVLSAWDEGREDLSDEDLEKVAAGVPIQSQLRAGGDETGGCCDINTR